MRRSLLFLLSLIAVVPLAAACGSADASSAGGTSAATAPSPPAQPGTEDAAKTLALAEVARTTRTVGPLRVHFAMIGIPASEGGDITADGVMDFRRGEFDLDYTIGGERIRLLFDGTRAYIQQPGTPLPGGKSWVLIDAAEAGLESGSMQDDPAELVRWLEVAGEGVTTVGEERVRGVPTTRVHATIDLEKAVELVPADERKAARAAFTKLGTMHMPIDVWIDGDGRIRRMTAVMSESPAITMSMTFYGFGAGKVTAPPAADVFDPATAS